MIRQFAAAVALALTGLVAAPSAAADIYTVTYEGEVFDSYDVNGTFGGNPGQGYDGSFFKALFVFTVPTPGALLNTDGATYVETLGGTALSVPSPGFGRLEIDNSPIIAGDVFALFLRQVVAGGADLVMSEAATSLANGGGASFQLMAGSADNSLFPSLDWTGTRLLDPTLPGMTGYGTFNVVAYDSLGNVASGAGGSLAVYSITIARETAGVPEPAAWAVLIVGFAIIGGALRRRRDSTPRKGAMHE